MIDLCQDSHRLLRACAGPAPYPLSEDEDALAEALAIEGLLDIADAHNAYGWRCKGAVITPMGVAHINRTVEA